MSMTKTKTLNCPTCGGLDFQLIFNYTAPPVTETNFNIKDYHREVWQCRLCRHFVSLPDFDDSVLYSGDYVNATYGSLEGLRRNFERIINLPSSKSDNTGRVKRVNEVVRSYWESSRSVLGQFSVLDVGSGLCVFLYRMKEAGWICTALDPDPRAVKHAQDCAGVQAVCGDFMTLKEVGKFDLVTFNKVLEHVDNPIAMLAKAKDNLQAGGLIYVEVPDGEMAAREGSGREEFFIEHRHVFSFTSLALLVERAGFTTLLMERLREPSTKYTLRAFLKPML